MSKRALLAGVNDYKGIGDLNGCVNDVTNMRNVLKTYFGFTNSDIRVLVDDRATKKNILTRLESMVADTKPGDLLVFHFSGHGSQIRDRDGDELKDQMDELICPWDMDWDGIFITDDMLQAIFNKMPKGSFLELFIDACHSGTMLRDLTFGRPENMGPPRETQEKTDTVIERFLPPPVDIKCRFDGEEENLKDTNTFKAASNDQILWSGCKSDQTSADARIDGTYNGAFTYYLCRHIRSANGVITRNELIKRVRDSLKHNNYSQIPQLQSENNSIMGYNVMSVPSTSKNTSKSKNKEVASIQNKLKDLGYIVQNGDGSEHAVRQALRHFQKDNNLSLTGYLDSETEKILFLE